MTKTDTHSKDWFMQQNFSADELKQLDKWDAEAGRNANIIPTEKGFNLFHILDKDHKIDLVFMKDKQMAINWGERLGYKIIES